MHPCTPFRVRHVFLLVLACLAPACSARERVIGLRENIHHDDFEYSVQEVARADRIGEQTPKGLFYIVTFKVENRAKRVDHEWGNDVAYVADEQGRVYENDVTAQKQLAASRPFGYRDHYVTAPGSIETTMLVFDVPKDVTAPYLEVRGAFLMGDMFDGNQFTKARVKLF